jgi:arabinogalactan oligomer / maltooligosaccharide transport system substrate-binding protein
MQRKLRTLRAAAALAAVALIVSACGGGGDEGGTTGGTTGGATTSGGELVIWVGGGPTGTEVKKLGEAFGQQNGVKVTVQIVPEELQTQFVTASQAGKAPDVVMGAHDWIGNLVQNGTIDPIQMTDQAKAAYEEQAIKAVTFNGQVYGVPFTMNNIVLFRNTDLAPEAPSSIEDLVATGKQLKASGKTSEILALPIGPTGDPYHINPLYTSGGGYMFGQEANGDYNPKDLGVAEPSAVEAYEKIGKLGEKGEGALKRSITTDNILSLFTAKKTAYMVSGPWQFADLNKSKIKYDVSPVPAFEGGKPASPFITVDAAYVASKGKNKTLAQEFVTNYWSTPEVNLALFKANPNVPALKAALEQLQSSDPMVVKVADAGRESGVIMPSIPEMAAVWDPLGKAEAAVVAGANPQTTVSAAAKAIQNALK